MQGSNETERAVSVEKVSLPTGPGRNLSKIFCWSQTFASPCDRERSLFRIIVSHRTGSHDRGSEKPVE